MDKKMLHMIAFILVVIGALNWGLVGLFGLNVVALIFSFMPALISIVYILVGISAIYLLVEHKGICKYCGGKK